MAAVAQPNMPRQVEPSSQGIWWWSGAGMGWSQFIIMPSIIVISDEAGAAFTILGARLVNNASVSRKAKIL